MTRRLSLQALHSVLFRPAIATRTKHQYGWLVLSLGFALWYGMLALQQAVGAEYVVQDDARQHVFWMQRFIESGVFPNDLIADYFQSVAPAGYQFVYRLAAWVGLSPLLFHKILPLGLDLLTAGLCFRVMLGLLPIPFAAFCSSVVLMQGLGLIDAIVSATPKAFIYPLLLLFIDGVVRQGRLTTWGAIALQGLFYPQLVLISSGVLVLRLVEWHGWRPRLVTARRDRLLCLGGLLVAFLVLLPYAVQTSEYGPTLTWAQARQLPELSMDGSRSQYFQDGDPAKYWLEGRSGLRPATIFTPVTNLLGLCLLALPWLPSKQFLRQTLQPNVSVLPQMVLASMGCFVLAHLLLFRLHLPSRYTQHSIKVIMTLAASIVVVAILERLWYWGQLSAPAARNTLADWGKAVIAGTLAFLLTAVTLGYPFLVAEFPLETYQYGQYPALYEFLRTQPLSSRVASLTREVNNIPTFAQRSIVTGSEYAIPYHIGYYQQIRQRTNELITAQYSLGKREIADFVQTYQVTHWLLDQNAFRPDFVESDRWIQQHPEAASQALANLQTNKRLPLARARKKCQIFRERNLILLDAQCVVR